MVRLLADAVPVRMAAFGEDEDHGPPAILEIRLTAARVRRQVFLMKRFKGSQRVVGHLLGGLARFVKHHRNIEVLFGGDGLDQGITFVQKRLPVPVPVHHESGNTQVFRRFDLLLDHDWILR